MVNQFLLLQQLASTNSIRKGKNHEAMPTLVRAHKFENSQVIRELTRLQNSIFVGASREELTEHIKIGYARRYLYILIVLNTRESSDLPSISEVDSQSPSNQGSDEKKYDTSIHNFVNNNIFNEDSLSERQSYLGNNSSSD